MTSFGSITIPDAGSLQTACKMLGSDDATNWVLINGNGSEVGYGGHGSGGIPDFVGQLKDGAVQFGLVQVVAAQGSGAGFDQKKVCFIVWTGPGTTTMMKAKTPATAGDLRAYVSKNGIAISAELMAEKKTELTTQSIMQAVTRTRTNADGTASNNNSSAAGSMHANAAPTPNWGDGIYFTMEYASEGSFFLNYSKTPVAGAMAFVKSGKPLAGFKYKKNGGKQEFARQVGGVYKKNFATAWCNLIKSAYDLDGTFILRSDLCSKSLSMYKLTSSAENNVEKLPFDKHIDFNGVVAIAIMLATNSVYNVQTMSQGLFAEGANGNTAGAAVVFPKVKGGAAGAALSKAKGSLRKTKTEEKGLLNTMKGGPGQPLKSGSITVLNPDMMEESLKKFTEAKSNLDWVLFGYEKEGARVATILYLESGSGGLDEVQGKLDDGKVQFFALRFDINGGKPVAGSDTTKVIFITWTGPGVTNNMIKAKAAAHKGDLLACVRRSVAVASELSVDNRASLNLTEIVQKYTRVRKGSSSGAKSAESIHLNASPTPNWGTGIYLTEEHASEGSFYIHYSKAPVPGAMAFIKPKVAIQDFKFTNSGGKNELDRKVGNVFRKNRCGAWVKFFKLAKDHQGQVILRSEIVQDIALYGLVSPNTVSKIPMDALWDPTSYAAIAVMGPGSTAYNVQTMEKTHFMSAANTAETVGWGLD